jgi:hypothetical protein
MAMAPVILCGISLLWRLRDTQPPRRTDVSNARTASIPQISNDAGANGAPLRRAGKLTDK